MSPGNKIVSRIISNPTGHDQINIQHIKERLMVTKKIYKSFDKNEISLLVLLDL